MQARRELRGSMVPGRWALPGLQAGRSYRVAALLAVPAAVGGVFYQPTVVDGPSMLPTLRSGQMVMTDRTHYWNHSPRRGEVVVIRHAGETCIKRIYGMPGETLYWVGDTDQPLVPIAQEMAPDLCRRWRGHARPVATRVPPDCVFVLGDNLLQSMDSRTFGPVPIRELVGRARLPVDLGPLRDHEFVPPDRHGRRQTRSAFRASL